MRKIHTIMTLTVNCRGLGEKRATNRAEPVPQAHGPGGGEGCCRVPRQPDGGTGGRERPMTGHGSKLSAKKKEAIAALLRMSVEDVAETIGITLRTLQGWLKEKEFSAELRAARRAEYRQCMARMRQGAVGAVQSTIQMMYQGKTPATRLKAARVIMGLAHEAIEIDDFAAVVQEAEDTIRGAEAGSLPPARGSKTSGKGHGAKLPHVKEAAIAALLVKRSVTEAAASVPIGTQTLYTWMQQPAFLARYMAEAGAVFGPAMMMAQQRLSDAVSVLRNLSLDTSIPEPTRQKADLYLIDEMKAHAVERSGEEAGEDGDAPGRKERAGGSIENHRHETPPEPAPNPGPLVAGAAGAGHPPGAVGQRCIQGDSHPIRSRATGPGIDGRRSGPRLGNQLPGTEGFCVEARESG
jgi:phage antirepressor YoqD-like protein